ncbi:hypothetical protein [Amniculibacterium sp. G2-70]|uniref:hypothetical protein n=1 Tax=Amniculibacterium sp. G2-70 TaxID=2767188 RepID=UPI0016542F73|nr:hypothetical protein [Amniculibacterium sp. G2-70]
MKKLSQLFFMLSFTLFFSQEKKMIDHTYTVFKNLQPNEKFDYWAVYFFDGDNLHQLKQYGGKKKNEVSDKGFLQSPIDHSYYYIVTEKGNTKNVITDNEGLKKFIGKIDNAYEAAAMMLLKGYFIDEEYQSVAGSFVEGKENYQLEMGLVSSENCPFAKKSYTLFVDKTTGLLLDLKEGTVYFEKYRKECKNNPHQQYKLNIKKP